MIPGTIRGYRIWGWGWNSQLLGFLGSITAEYNWRTADYQEAQCGTGRFIRKFTASFDEIAVPEEGCDCGFYACHTLSRLYLLYPHLGLPSGVIEAQGRVIVGEDGFRAQRARIIALCHRDEHVAEFLQNSYRVPVFRQRQDMAEAFPPTSIDNLLAAA